MPFDSKAYHKEWKKKNPERVSAQGKRYAVKNKEKIKTYNAAWHKAHPERGRVRGLQRYGITVAEYESLLKAQGGVCAVCRHPETTKCTNGADRIARLSVDHCHATGKVRGLTCHGCNTGIAKFGDSPHRLRAAAEYLDRAATQLGRIPVHLGSA